jgi:hypothetical protein
VTGGVCFRFTQPRRPDHTQSAQLPAHFHPDVGAEGDLRRFIGVHCERAVATPSNRLPIDIAGCGRAQPSAGRSDAHEPDGPGAGGRHPTCPVAWTDNLIAGSIRVEVPERA